MTKQIILIEDDMDARLLLKCVLTKEGYTVTEFSDSNTFFNSNDKRADLFIIESGMSTIDGIALTKYLKIKTDTKNVPVLVISDNGHVAKRAYKAGAADFICKPFEASKFIRSVNRLIVGNSYVPEMQMAEPRL